jgi:hypothetical protein
MCVRWFLTYFPYLKKLKEAHEILLSVYLCVPPIVARKRLGKHIPAATNAKERIEELLDAVFFLRSVSYQIICGERKFQIKQQPYRD